MNDYLTWMSLRRKLEDYDNGLEFLAIIDRYTWPVSTVAAMKMRCLIGNLDTTPVVVIKDKFYYGLEFGECEGCGCPVIELEEFVPLHFDPDLED